MNISCNIIKDLLPLYHDEVCGSDSRRMVEKHLAECDNCTSELQAMAEKIPMNKVKHNLQEAEAIKNFSEQSKRRMKKSLIKAAIITVILFALLGSCVGFSFGVFHHEAEGYYEPIYQEYTEEH